MAEEITKVIENVDELFPEIVVNGESHISERYVAPEPTPSQSLPQSSEEQTETQPQQTVQGEYVDTLELNGVTHDLKDSPLSEAVDSIEGMIPNQASSSNQLADKNFVNSSIATNTANFLGTYQTLADIEAIQNPTNNDYAFLETTDSSGNTLYSRYKYNGDTEEWLFEYELNNSSFTAEQWATINSGLTQTSVENLVDDEITEALTSPTLKQPIFDFIHPIGEVYIQFPLQSDPATLYNQGGIVSTWTEVNYDGAFFRANGGNADSFIASGTLTKQASQNLAHSHTVEAHDHGGYTGYTQPTFSGTKISNQRVGLGKYSGTNLTPTGVFSMSGTGTGSSNMMCNGDNNDSRGVYMNYTPSGTVQNHRHTIESASPATDSIGGTEARPENYTVKVWKRTA